MQADQELLRSETRAVVRRALMQYDNPEAVLLYAASKRHKWQDLNRRARMDPSKLSKALNGVQDHLEAAVSKYLFDEP